MFIMTSEATKVATHQFLEKHQYFGLSKEQVLGDEFCDFSLLWF